MQDVADDLLCVLQWLAPQQLDGGRGDGSCFHFLRRTRKSVGPQHGQAGTGLGGPRTVFGDTLVDGLIRLTNVGDGERAGWETIKPGKLSIF